MMTTFERLRAILVKDYKLAPESLALAAPLEGLGIDSLGVAELLFTVEDEFAIKVSSEPVQLSTVGDVVRYIDELVASQHSAGHEAGAQGTSAATSAGTSTSTSTSMSAGPSAEDIATDTAAGPARSPTS